MESAASQRHEEILLTRLFVAQRRLRFVRSVRAALVWFSIGAGVSTLGLIILWNWNLLPGPWQWMAAAGRPVEFLWLPLLLGLGGFASRWFTLPEAGKSAFRLDRLLDSHETLLTAIDWIYSEKPRTLTSERLLSIAVNLVEDESKFLKLCRELEPVPRRAYLSLLTLLLPLLLVIMMPAHAVLTPDGSVWLGAPKVDQLTEELLKELEETGSDQKTQEKLEELLKKMTEDEKSALAEEEKARSRRELQRLVDELHNQSEAASKRKELLETLAQRARQAQPMTEKDKTALEALRRKMDGEAGEKLERAAKNWGEQNFQEAAQALEQLQKEAGQKSQALSEQASEAIRKGELSPDGGQEFQEGEGDQFDEDGFARGEKKNGNARGKAGQGQGNKEGDGPSGMQPGEGTTLEEQPSDGTPKQSPQSLRRSDRESTWTEEYEKLHPPERTEFQKAQTRVRGEAGEDGPRYRTAKEGRGAVTAPSAIDGSGGILEYREEAENAILRDEVPADYRDQVRQYFESLDKGY